MIMVFPEEEPNSTESLQKARKGGVVAIVAGTKAEKKVISEQKGFLKEYQSLRMRVIWHINRMRLPPCDNNNFHST